MKYNFDQIVDRSNTGSLKWDIKKNELPLWVADMDFKTAPEIIDALQKRMDNGIFGYSIVPDQWYDAYIHWWKTRHNFTLNRDWLIFSTGVIPIISSCVRKLTTANENVLIQTPVYNIFFNSIINNGCRVIENQLKYDGKKFSIDFKQLEKDLSDPQTTLMILCNPHNPCGNIWSKSELAKIGDLCKKYNVTVISDEIHCDITKPGKEYIPFASVNETCRDISITCIAPTKTFNIAGLNTAAVSVPDPVLRHKVWRALNTDEVAEPNAFAVTAAIAAFTKGADWLDQLKTYLWNNRKYAESFIAENVPALKPVKSDSTYLMWCECTTMDGDDYARLLRKKTGLYISGGSQFGTNGRKFVRINLACPKAILEDALNRLTNVS